MTREECEKALECLFDELCENDIFLYETCKSRDVLDGLIHEHFDNPPLSFADLKEGMWVWDDREKRYEKIHGAKLSPHVLFGRSEAKVLHVVDMGWCITFFKENRFYRRQKED